MIVSCNYQVFKFYEDDYEIIEEDFDYEDVEMTVENVYLAVKYWEKSTSGKIEISDFFTSDVDIDLHDGTGRRESIHIDSATPAELLELNHLLSK